MGGKDILIPLAILGTTFFVIMLVVGISWYLSNHRIIKESQERRQRNEDILSGKMSIEDVYNYISKNNR